MREAAPWRHSRGKGRYPGHSPGAPLAFAVRFNIDHGWDKWMDRIKLCMPELIDHTFLTEMCLVSVTHLEGREVQNWFGELLCCFLETKVG